MAASMNMAVFWGVVSSSLIEKERRFRGTYCFLPQGDENGETNKHLCNIVYSIQTVVLSLALHVCETWSVTLYIDNI
jgi:hypothetical protein